MEVGDHDGVDRGVVETVRSLANTPLPQSSSTRAPRVLDEIATARAAGVLPSRRLPEHPQLHGDQPKPRGPPRPVACATSQPAAAAAVAGYAPRPEGCRQAAGAGRHACRAACSCAVGNCQAACRRRSCRNTKRIWRGGRSPSGVSGRNVAHGWSSCQRAQSVPSEEAVIAGHLATLAACVHPRPFRSPNRHRTTQQTTPAADRKAGVLAKRMEFCVYPANTLQSG